MNKLHEEIIENLEKLDINYKIVNHPAAHSTEEADRYIEGHEGLRSKTMFLTNKRKNKCFMLVMDDKKRLDMNSFAEIVDQSRIKMASEELLWEKLEVIPGVISPLALLNDNDNEIEIYFDNEIMDEKIMTFHPNTNEETIFIATNDLIRFLENMNYSINYINI